MPNIAELITGKRGRVLPAATSSVHINPDRQNLGFGTKQSDAARNRATLDRLVRRGYLENEFFGNSPDEPSGTPRFVERILDNGSRIGMVGSDVGYFELNGVIVATDLPQLEPEELIRRQHEIVSTKLPQHLNESLRLAYTAAMLAGLSVSRNLAKDAQIPLVVQHVTPDVTRPHLKYPRSIPWAHATFGNVDLRTFSEGTKKSAHLEAEQSAVDFDYQTLLALSLYGYIDAALRGTEFEERQFDVRPREIEPFGHELMMDIPADQITDPNQIRYVATMLDLQQDGYVNFHRENGSVRPVHLVGSDGVVYRRKPQPASRDYLLVGDTVLRAVKSHMEYSHAGAIEAAGATLIRSPGVDPLEEPETVFRFRKAAAYEIEKAIEVVSFK